MLSLAPTKSILAIGPHGDDVEFGAAGYLARAVKEDIRVRVVVMAMNDDVRFREMEASLSTLGIEDYRVLNPGKDSLLDTLPQCELIGQIELEVQDFQPDELLIPLPSSHQDHVAVHRACLSAMRPSASTGVKLVAAYEYPATGWGGVDYVGQGGMYINIEDTLEQKIKSLCCYESQISKEPGYVFSTEAAKDLAKVRGFESNTSAAELLRIMRALR